MTWCVLVLVSLLAQPAFGAWLDVTAKSFDTDGTTTQIIPHTRNPTLPLGDSHKDVEFDAAQNNTPSEVAYSHFPYPPDFPDTNPAQTVTFRFNYETNETDNTKQHCVRTRCVAVPDDSDFAGDVGGENADTIMQPTSNGGGFVGRFVSPASTAVHILKSDIGSTCNQVTCGHTWVKCVHYRLDTMGGACTNPSTATFRIFGYEVTY